MARLRVVSDNKGPRQPRQPDDWIRICERELANIAGTYKGHVSNDVKIDCALKAIEAVLKAIIWKHEGWIGWPANKKGFHFLYLHNLEGLLDHSGLRSRLRLSTAQWASWQVIINASLRHSRYSPDTPTDAEAHDVARSARYPDTGVIPWLLRNYRAMS